MSVLNQLAHALATGGVRIIDLTSKLSSQTPILKLPEQFGQTAPFELEPISNYDDKGPAWYWNNIHTGEHTGTHFDAPNHWITGKDREDISQVPIERLIRPAAVLDFSSQVAADPDYLLTVQDVQAWQATYGALPDGGWLIYRTGWSANTGDQQTALNANETGPHTPGMTSECARYLAEETSIIGIGVETIGTDAGIAHSMEPMYPCHNLMHGNGKYGITQLQNVHLLPPTGAMIVTAPLPIVGGSGSPARILALVEQ